MSDKDTIRLFQRIEDQDRRFYEQMGEALDAMGVPRHQDQESKTTAKIIPLWRK